MNTSYYAKSSKLLNAVSIAIRPPFYLRGKIKEYTKLAPQYWFLKIYKQDGNEKYYTEQYQKYVLDLLNPKKVFDELGQNAVLLCYERPEKFCHRHLVAKWLEKHLNIKVVEL
jgi:uncharacterized protein (DUF488 family)